MSKLRQLQPLIVKYRGWKIVMNSNNIAWIKNQVTPASTKLPGVFSGGFLTRPTSIGSLEETASRNRSNVRALIDRWWLEQPLAYIHFQSCDEIPWDIHAIANRTAHAMAAQGYRTAKETA